jgi:hypothetical protein
MHAAAPASDSERPPPPCDPQRAARPFQLTSARRAALYIDMATAAKMLGWSVIRTKRHLQRSKAAIKRGGRWYTTRSLLLRRLAEEAPEALARLPESDRGDR